MRVALLALGGWLLGGCVLVPAPAPYAYAPPPPPPRVIYSYPAYPVYPYAPYYYRHWYGR
jgi:hypothetical protein